MINISTKYLVVADALVLDGGGDDKNHLRDLECNFDTQARRLVGIQSLLTQTTHSRRSVESGGIQSSLSSSTDAAAATASTTRQSDNIEDCNNILVVVVVV